MKDPAALLYIDKWITATTEMRANARAYYMDLILFQFDKGSLPNDIEELANICRVRISEFNMFKQVFEQVLKHKFVINDEGRLINEFANEIITKRQKFIEKRSNAGKLSYVLKYFRANFKITKKLEKFIKDNIDLDFDIKNEQVLKQVFKQISELYINEDEDEDENKNEDRKIIFPYETENFKKYWQIYKEYRKKEHGFKYKGITSEQAALKKISEISNSEDEAVAIIMQTIENGWKGLFELKDKRNGKGNDQAELESIFAKVDQMYEGR